MEAGHDPPIPPGGPLTAPPRPPGADFPPPIARLVAIATDAAEPADLRRTALLKAPECLLRVACIPLLAYALRHGSPHIELSKVMSAFSTPFFLTWRWLARVLGQEDLEVEWGPLAGYHAAFSRAYEEVKEATAVARPEYAFGASGEWVNLLDMFQRIRNTWAHSSGSRTPEALCLRDLNDYLPGLQRILAAFDFLRLYRYRIRSASETGAEGPAEVNLLTPSGQEVPLHPFVTGDTATGALLWFDGYRLHRDEPKTTDALAYQTDGERCYETGPNTAVLRALFKRHAVLLLPGAKYLTLAKLVDYFSAVTRQNLRELDARYSRDLFVDRPELTRALREFALGPRDARSPVALLLTGVAGSGKSGLLVNLARELMAEPGGRSGVLLMRGDKLTVDPEMRQILFANLLLMVGADRDELRTFDDLCKQLDRPGKDDGQGRRLVILFDGVNEASDRPEKVYRELLDLVATAHPYPWIRIVAAIREEFVLSFRANLEAAERDPIHGIRHLFATPGPDLPEEFRLESLPVWVVPRITSEERREIYERFGRLQADGAAGVPACLTPWGELDPAIREEILDRPLLIRLWMELYDRRPAGRLHTVSDLYIAYLDSLEVSSPNLARVALPLVVEHMLREGRSVLTEEDAARLRIEREGRPVEALAALVRAGLFEVRVPTTGPVRYRVFHERMAEALAARWLRESVGYPAHSGPEAPAPAIELARLKSWDGFRRDARNSILFGGLELLVRRLMELGDWGNVARLLEHVDFQMPPASSWLFLAGRHQLSIEFREALDRHLTAPRHRQENLFQLGLGYIRAGRHEEALATLRRARALCVGAQMRAAISMYLGLGLIREGHYDEGEAELKTALREAQGTAIEGNVYGHLASLRVKRLRRDGAGVPPRQIQDEIERLYRRAIELNGDERHPDRRSEQYWHKEWGETLLEFRRAREAVDELETAWLLCVSHGMDAKCRLDLHYALGKAYRSEGRSHLAEEQLQLGLRLAAEIGDGELQKAIEAIDTEDNALSLQSVEQDAAW